jgi:hypothetical protein
MFIDYITVFKCLELNFWSLNQSFILPVKASKGWFTDGHEREGVVKYGDEHFLEKMK